MKLKRLFIAILVVSLVVAIADAQRMQVVDYPEGYRSWQHLKSMVIQPGHPLENPFGGIHHVYANDLAMDGLNSGKYADGSIFVFDLLSYDGSGNQIVETERKRLDVMQYNVGLFSETDGWGYDTFVGDSTSQRLDQDVIAACYGCHVSAKETGYIFSKYRP